MDAVVVVGAGVAGWRASHELRAQGFTGRIVLVGEEDHAPYDRPPLSKEVLAGAGDPVLAPAVPGDVDARRGARAAALDVDARVLVLDDGERLSYDGLVIACGSVPRLPLGWSVPGVLTLRTWDDAVRLRGRLSTADRLLLVGAGWIGAEVATAAIARGVDVVAVEPRPAPLAAALPEPLAASLAAWWLDAGGRLRCGAGVVAFEPVDDGIRALLDDGGHLVADAALVGIGVRPATDWLVGSGVRLDGRGAVLVDERLVAAPGVVAVGDCAARWSPRFGRHVGSEHWQEAMDGPTVAVSSLLGNTPDPFDPVPWLWSRQWGRMVTWVGWRTTGDRVVARGDVVTGGTAALVHDGDDGPRLTAVLSADRPRDAADARRVLVSAGLDGVPVDEDALADPRVRLADTVRRPGPAEPTR